MSSPTNLKNTKEMTVNELKLTAFDWIRKQGFTVALLLLATYMLWQRDVVRDNELKALYREIIDTQSNVIQANTAAFNRNTEVITRFEKKLDEATNKGK